MSGQFIEDGCEVELDYELLDAEGKLAESSEKGGPMRYVHGRGELPPRLEESLRGRGEGDELELTLPAGEAFGDYNPDGILAIPRSDLPEGSDPRPGEWIEVCLSPDEGEEDAVDGDLGQELEMRVVESNASSVVLDANHPLAGQEVTFQLVVRSVRPT